MYIKKVTNSATPVTAVVVDNLTSDSSTDALSAKQGKILNEKIENLDLSGLEGLTAVDSFPIGAIVEWPSDADPEENWLLCLGQAISRTEYAELFAVLGTTWGAGDGSTTFNIPTKEGLVTVGKKVSDTDFNTLGKIGGEKTHTLTIDEMPSHDHSLPGNDDVKVGQWKWITTGDRFGLYSNSDSDGGYPIVDIPSSGGDQPHNNLQPHVVSNFIIKAKQGTSENGTLATAPEIAIQNEEPTGQEVLWIEENNDIIDLDIEDTISVMVDDKLSELFVDGEVVMDYTVGVETDQIEFTALNLTPEYKYDITIEGSSSQGGDIMVRVNGITHATYHSMGSYYNNSDTANADYQYNNGIRHNIDHWYYGFSLYSTPTKLNATLELVKDLSASVYLPVATWQSFSCWNGVGFRSDVKGTCTDPVSSITKLTFTLFDGNYVPGTRFIIKKYRKLI